MRSQFTDRKSLVHFNELRTLNYEPLTNIMEIPIFLPICRMMLVMGLLFAGCGQEQKKENEQLKAQVASLQKENADLKTGAMALKGDNEVMKKQLDEMKQHMEQMQQQMKGGKAAKKK